MRMRQHLLQQANKGFLSYSMLWEDQIFDTKLLQSALSENNYLVLWAGNMQELLVFVRTACFPGIESQV